MAKFAVAVTPPASHWRPEGGEVDPESPLGMVWAGVRDGSVSPSLATAVLRELERLGPLLREEAKQTVTTALLDLGRTWGPAMMRRLRPRLLAEHGLAGVLDDLQERLAPAARLSSPFVESGDLTEYQLLMTPGAGGSAGGSDRSAQCPRTQRRDRRARPPAGGQRRVEALTEVCRRSSAADADSTGGADGAAGAASAVHVIIPLSDLEARTGCGEVRRVDRHGHGAVAGGPAAHLVRGRPRPARARHRGRGPRPGSGGATVHPGAAAPADASRPVLHLPRMHGSRELVACAPRRPLGRRRALGHRQRSAAVPAAPHRGPPASAHRRGAQEARRAGQVRRVGPVARELRPHLDRLRAERSANDPPPLTPERLRSLVDAINGDDPDEQRWARYELDASAPDEEWSGEWSHGGRVGRRQPRVPPVSHLTRVGLAAFGLTRGGLTHGGLTASP